MELPAAQLLAETDPVKLVSGLVVIAFWVIGALITAASKKREQADRQKVRESLESGARERGALQPTARQQPIAPPPLPQRVPPPLADEIRMRIPARMTRPQKKQKPQKVKPTAAVFAQPPAIVEAETSHRTTTDLPLPAPRAQPTIAAAPAIHQWLRPDTLRKQFIITELLQPPLSLRE